MSKTNFTPAALGALRLAQENAARLGHSYVGSEHLLLGPVSYTHLHHTLAGSRSVLLYFPATAMQFTVQQTIPHGIYKADS